MAEAPRGASIRISWGRRRCRLPLPDRNNMPQAFDPSRDDQVLTTLLDINQILSGTPNLRSALRRVLESLGRHGIARSSVTLLNAESGQLHVEASHGISGDAQRT